MNDFPAMRVALESGTIDGYVSEVPEGITAERANPNLMYIHFAKGQGFKTDASDTNLAIGLRKNDPNKAKIFPCWDNRRLYHRVVSRDYPDNS
ncbi:Uncharacterised protein [Mycobacteroides abscessus subsp. abscessus]|nr:Uncharacterised protein [Mycobacteroides abscessus subsp. abscessus]